ncbi:folate metabolism, CADD family protein [Neorickettsia helminthoeca str. Oregon]|uniref:Folate metabolism, CADD family protein n=1 Tax=Neorickettsia helminthoeca str. Oregon TaxID=1286528 RepID=X5H3Y9_9RICK|nr:CADD family putative folate metabolism protein [Neorickettsia helminthoeca]AHX11408.1 folate metabolism, CADD family protein [Neorickettsia helminthoeca str. Oregon]
MFTKELEPLSILKHDFYKSWESGNLSREDLQEYACQYFNHVNETPRYLSTIHSKCRDIKVRQVLLDNLVDEERGEENHPKLWLDFCAALGLTQEKVRNAKLLGATKQLSDTFFKLSSSSVSEGIGALYAYERQIPDIARVKIESLKKFYGIEKDEELKFFSVHIEADEWHSEECENLLKRMNLSEIEVAKEAALKLASALWKFLDGMEQVRLTKNYLNV